MESVESAYIKKENKEKKQQPRSWAEGDSETLLIKVLIGDY